MTISRTVISLRVNVPVLSEQITVTDPSVSTLGSLRTSAFRLTMRCRPNASVNVTTAGRPSGTAATARLTEINSISSNSPPRASCSKKMTTTMTRQTNTSTLPSSASRRCSGVRSGAERCNRPAMCPNSVSMPIATTIALAFPAAVTVPM